jgi:hypothetical protein
MSDNMNISYPGLSNADPLPPLLGNMDLGEDPGDDPVVPPPGGGGANLPAPGLTPGPFSSSFSGLEGGWETWKNLVDALCLEPHELAYYLARDHEHVSLCEESTIPNNHLDLEHSVTAATIKTMMGAHPGTKYFLMVVVGKVQVLFGLAQCFALV